MTSLNNPRHTTGWPYAATGHGITQAMLDAAPGRVLLVRVDASATDRVALADGATVQATHLVTGLRPADTLELRALTDMGAVQDGAGLVVGTTYYPDAANPGHLSDTPNGAAVLRYLGAGTTQPVVDATPPEFPPPALYQAIQGGRTKFEATLPYPSLMTGVHVQVADWRGISDGSPRSGQWFIPLAELVAGTTRSVGNDVYVYTFASVVNEALDTIDLTVTDTHSGQDNAFGGVVSMLPQYPLQTSAGGDLTVTARYRPLTDHIAGDPIIEPNPNTGDIHVWTADEDFRTGANVEFDGDGWTMGEKVENPVGTEIHIRNLDPVYRLFSGFSIGKALDVILDANLMSRVFRKDLATQIYGSTGSGKIGTAIDPTDGMIYAVRLGRTVTDDKLPSQSSNWIRLYPGRAPPNALVDILAIPFEVLVAQTGAMLWAADTHELLLWDTNATPENVAPRKTYGAAAEPIPFIQGKWVVLSPQPPGGEDSHVLLAEEAGTTGTTVIPCNESMASIKANYQRWEIYSVSAGFGVDTSIQSPGAILLTEQLTDGVPIHIDVSGRDLIFTPQDNGAANMTLLNNSLNAGPQDFKVYGVRKQTTVVTVNSEDLVVDLAGAVVGDDVTLADDGAGGLKLIRKEPQPPTEPSRIYTRVQDQAIPDANWNTYAVDLPEVEAGDEFTVVVARGALVYDLVGRFLSFGQQHEFVFAGIVWRVEIIGTQFRIQAATGGGAQVVKAIFMERQRP